MIALALLIAACGDVQGSGAPGTPGLLLIDSVALQEGDSAFVGQPFDIEIASDGSFLISDLFSKRVLVFHRDGSFARSIGRAGSGPGEFGRPTRLALGGDSLFYVLDGMLVKLIDPRDLTYTGSLTLPRRPGALAVSEDRLFVGQSDPERESSVVYTGDRGATFAATGHLPSILQNSIVEPMFGGITLAASGDRVATAYIVTNMVYITDLATGVVDSIPVPAVHRRGADPEVFVQMGEAPTEELGAAAMASSLPVRMSWLPSGVIALVSKDSEMDGLVYLTAATQYLSLIDPATRATCVDALVPGPSDPPVTVGFHGDTLFVLSQTVDSVSSGEAMMRMYRIDRSSCPGFAAAD